jgi:ribonuclease Z
MECIALGIGGMMPMPQRLTTSVLVRREGRMLMFDAGEGIQLALKRGGLGIRALDAVVISHLHADHVLGLPGIMMFRAQNDDPGPLTLIGPPGLGRFIRHTLEDLHYHINFKYNVIEWSDDAGTEAWLWGDVRLTWERLSHSTFCLGYRLDESQRPGRFNTKQAIELGVPPGPLFGELQAGKTIVTPAGKTVSPEQVLGPSRRGRSMVFATDTKPCVGVERLLKGADIGFVEGMFANEHEAEALAKKHMTAAQAAKIASRVGNVGQLLLVHISPRYSLKDESILEAEAREHFDKARVARPLEVYTTALPD